jgi:hypothetical protein
MATAIIDRPRIAREPSMVILPKVEIVTQARGASILNTPGPWTREFLDANGLRVAYRHGHAKLEFRR